MSKKTNSGLKIICLNRKASFNYFFEDLLEAGIVLKGSEIKSIRAGKVNIADSYAIEKKGEIILISKRIASRITSCGSSVYMFLMSAQYAMRRVLAPKSVRMSRWYFLSVLVMSLHAHKVKDFMLEFLRMKDRPREA